MNEAATVSPSLRARPTSSPLRGFLASPPGLRLGVLLIIIVVWELVARLWGNPMFVAPPSEVVAAAVKLMAQRDLLGALGMVIVACVVAFILSVAIGALIGLVVGSNLFLRDAFFPIILMLYATPQSPFLPLITITFGTGIEAKIVYGFTHGVFPMAVTVIGGLQNVDQRLVVAAQSMGATRWHRLIHVTMPFILQGLFTGMRMTMAVVILGVLLSELYISNGGIGFFTRMYSNRFEPNNLFALIAMLAIIAITLNETCRRVEIAYSAWRSRD